VAGKSSSRPPKSAVLFGDRWSRALRPGRCFSSNWGPQPRSSQQAQTATGAGRCRRRSGSSRAVCCPWPRSWSRWTEPAPDCRHAGQSSPKREEAAGTCPGLSGIRRRAGSLAAAGTRWAAHRTAVASRTAGCPTVSKQRSSRTHQPQTHRTPISPPEWPLPQAEASFSRSTRAPTSRALGKDR
jgi:hypothetical protein